MNVDSIRRCRYDVLFKDDCTSYRIVKCIKKKFDDLTSFQEMINQVHPNTHYRIHIFWIDCGGEYIGIFLNWFLKKELI
jgi:hypothetical protein